MFLYCKAVIMGPKNLVMDGKHESGPVEVQRLTGRPPESLTQFVARTCCHCEFVFLARCVISSDGETDCRYTRGREFPQPIYHSLR